jgi:hypothetical protein
MTTFVSSRASCAPARGRLWAAWPRPSRSQCGGKKPPDGAAARVAASLRCALGHHPHVRPGGPDPGRGARRVTARPRGAADGAARDSWVLGGALSCPGRRPRPSGCSSPAGYPGASAAGGRRLPSPVAPAVAGTDRAPGGVTFAAGWSWRRVPCAGPAATYQDHHPGSQPPCQPLRV